MIPDNDPRLQDPAFRAGYEWGMAHNAHAAALEAGDEKAVAEAEAHLEKCAAEMRKHVWGTA